MKDRTWKEHLHPKERETDWARARAAWHEIKALAGDPRQPPLVRLAARLVAGCLRRPDPPTPAQEIPPA